MTLALLTLLVVGQEPDAPPPVPPAETETAVPAAAMPAPAEPVRVDPGWAREGAVAGFALSAVPLGLAVAAMVMMWTGNQTAQDWLTVGSGLSAPLVALVPTYGGRSAVLPSEELARRPKIFRIVGWVMVIYGAAGLVGGVAFGKLWAFIAEKTGFNWGKLSSNMNVEQTAVTIGRVIGTVTTLFSAAICSAGVIFLSAGSNISAKRAEESMGLMPTVAFVPLPGGGYAVMGGLGGRM